MSETKISAKISRANKLSSSAEVCLREAINCIMKEDIKKAERFVRFGVVSLKRTLLSVKKIEESCKRVQHSDETEIGRQIELSIFKIDEGLNFCLKIAETLIEDIYKGKTQQSIYDINNIIDRLKEIRNELSTLLQLNLRIFYFVREGFGT